MSLTKNSPRGSWARPFGYAWLGLLVACILPLAGAVHADLFPLPVGSAADLARRGDVDRPVRGRAGPAQRHDWTTPFLDEACVALNALGDARAGRGLGRPRHPAPRLPTAHQLAARERLERSLRDVGQPPDGNDRDAQQDLLKSTDVYNLDKETTRRPYEASKVRVVRDGVVLRDILGFGVEEVNRVLNDPWRFIVKPDEEMSNELNDELIEPYTDPRLRRRSEMLHLVRTLAAQQFVVFRTRRRARVGVFTVARKDDMLRLVFDCRPANHLHRAAPSTALATPSAFCSLNVSASRLARDGVRRGDLVGGSVDLVDGLYQLGYSRVAEFFALDVTLQAREVGIHEAVDPTTNQMVLLQPDDPVFACLGILPMGWSWSLWACQLILGNLMTRSIVRAFGVSDEVSQQQLLLDRRPAPQVRPRLPVAAPYVDNANWIAANVHDLTKIMTATSDVLSSLGLKFRVEQDAVGQMDVIGLYVDLQNGWIRNTARSTWRLYRALRRIVFQRFISGFALRVVVGHLCHFFMVRRPALAVLSREWKFIEEARDDVRWLDDEVVRELDVARGLLLVLRHNLGSEVAPFAYATDASMAGYGVLTTKLTLDEAWSMLRYEERWRFHPVSWRATVLGRARQLRRRGRARYPPATSPTGSTGASRMTLARWPMISLPSLSAPETAAVSIHLLAALKRSMMRCRPSLKP